MQERLRNSNRVLLCTAASLLLHPPSQTSCAAAPQRRGCVTVTPTEYILPRGRSREDGRRRERRRDGLLARSPGPAMNKCCIRTGKSRRERERERERERGRESCDSADVARKKRDRSAAAAVSLPHTKDRNGGGMAALARSSGVESLLFRDGHISQSVPVSIPTPNHPNPRKKR